jgi:hypothetical protein
VIGGAAGRAYTPVVAAPPSTAHETAFNRAAPSSGDAVKRKALVYDFDEEDEPLSKVPRTLYRLVD